MFCINAHAFCSLHAAAILRDIKILWESHSSSIFWAFGCLVPFPWTLFFLSSQLLYSSLRSPCACPILQEAFSHTTTTTSPHIGASILPLCSQQYCMRYVTVYELLEGRGSLLHPLQFYTVLSTVLGTQEGSSSLHLACVVFRRGKRMNVHMSKR